MRLARSALVVMLLASLVGSIAFDGAAAAPSDAALSGLWDRDDGLGGVRIAPCGEALCGDVVWLKHPEGPAHVGERLLYGLRRTAEATWTGSAVNPEDRGTYAGTVRLAGDHLTMEGCAAFGLICRSVGLTRAALPHR